MRNAWQSLRKSVWCRVATRLCYNLRLFSLPNSRLCKHGRRVSACSPLKPDLYFFVQWCCLPKRNNLQAYILLQRNMLWTCRSAIVSERHRHMTKLKLRITVVEVTKAFHCSVYSKTETKPHTLHKFLVFIQSDPIVMSKILSSKCLYLIWRINTQVTVFILFFYTCGMCCTPKTNSVVIKNQ